MKSVLLFLSLIISLIGVGCSLLQSNLRLGNAYYMSFETFPKITFWDYFPVNINNPIFDTIIIRDDNDSLGVKYLYNGKPIEMAGDIDTIGDDIAHLTITKLNNGEREVCIKLKGSTTSTIDLIYQGRKITLPLSKNECLLLLSPFPYTEGWIKGIK